MTKPGLNRLEVFRAVVEEGTMVAAGERLFISQPAISAHIRALHSELGIELLRKRGRRLELTDAGRVLYERAVSLLSQLEDLSAEMRGLAGEVTDKLVVGASGLWETRLPSILSAYISRTDADEVEVRTGTSAQVERWIDDGIIEIGLMGREPRPSSLRGREVADDEAILVGVGVGVAPGPGALAGARVASPAHQPWDRAVLPPHGSALRLSAERILGSMARSAPSHVLTLASRSACLTAVRSGVGVGVFATTEVALHLRRGDLIRLDSENDGVPLTLHVAHRRDRSLTGPSKVFAEVVSSWARDGARASYRAA